MKRTLPCLLLVCLIVSGCAAKDSRRMEVTAYCGCGKCCGWERGRWRYLKLNFWNRYVTSGKRKGQPYSGLTASGKNPHQPRPGLISTDSIVHPWMIPVRLIFFPWLLMPRDGTIAADTRYYVFGTRMHIPGYGWGVVEDRGSAIKGPGRIDIYFNSHQDAIDWGRKRVEVQIER